MSNEDDKGDLSAKLESLMPSPGYAFSQLSKALRTATEHEDVETRERLIKKADKWLQLFSNILSGKLHIGSRTPIDRAPAWVTPEVLTGGFATGELLAGGQLQSHERELLNKLNQKPKSQQRTLLNGYFLSDEGIGELNDWLSSGSYEINVAEEGALAVAALLFSRDNTEGMSQLLEQIEPYFSELRFYPVPSQRTIRVPLDSKVFLQDVGGLITSLRKVSTSKQVLAQIEAITVWIPLYDRMIEMLLETVKGETPYLDLSGAVSGGVPNASVADDWRNRASGLLKEYQELRKSNNQCKKPDKKKGSFYQIRHFLRVFAENSEAVKENEVARVRQLLARYIAKRGAPHSERWQQERARQEQQVAGLTFDRIAEILIERLSEYHAEEGLEKLEPITQEVSDEKGFRSEVPSYFIKKIHRCLYDTVDSLITLGVITSGDTLAAILPKITASIHAQAFDDPTLQKLYYSIYRAFRRRRSLLLLNLEGQVRLEELPWVAALNELRSPDSGEKEIAKRCLQEVATLTLTSFPYAMVPNKLLQECRALAKQAELQMPLVDELAADIFMGTFSGKFLNAAKVAAGLLQGTVYEEYYSLDYGAVLKINDSKASKYGPATSGAFAKLCAGRVPKKSGDSFVVQNGMVIEQQQIITTQNLAVLFDTLDLAQILQSKLPEMATRCFTHICSRQQMKISDYHARLVMKKNTAYAWRQMVFYLSLLGQGEQQAFVDWAKTHLSRQSKTFRQSFEPIFFGLACLINTNEDDITEVVRPFTGWGSSSS